MTARQWYISAFVLAVLGMQASTFITGTWVWPFMAYCMYTQVSYGPPSTVVIRVTALLTDAREMPIDADVVGLPWHAWHRNFERPMMAGDETVAREAARRIAAAHAVTVRSLRVNVTRYKIMPGEGMVELAESVAFDITRPVAEGPLP